MMEKLSFVIPCYGSEQTIRGVIDEIKDEMAALSQYKYEIILVNDCSPDHVWREIELLCKENSNIVGINLAKNFGQHAALMAGYRECEGDIVISLDDDGQSPVNEVSLFLDKIHEGYDVVYGEYPEIKQSGFRKFGSKLNDIMATQFIGKPDNIKMNSYYAAKKYIIDEMVKYQNAYPYVGGLVLRSTRNVTNVLVHQREREIGASGYTLKKLLKLWLNGFTAFSEKPLRFASIMGVVCASLGFMYGIFTIVHKLVNPMVQMGYSSLMAAILFIGGMIMLLLGIIGEYIGRIYISINNSPQYVIKEKVGKDEKE